VGLFFRAPHKPTHFFSDEEFRLEHMFRKAHYFYYLNLRNYAVLFLVSSFIAKMDISFTEPNNAKNNKVTVKVLYIFIFRKKTHIA